MFFYGFLGISYDFRWNILWTPPHDSWLLDGLLMTLKLSAFSWIIAVLIGILVGALRTVPFKPLRMAATGYVEFFRNVPLLVWLFFWYFGAPEALPEWIRQWLIRNGAEFICALAGVSFYHGARMSEVIRAGIQSIPKTQLEAGLSTGLSVFQTYRLVIIPIALRLIVPPLTNESLNLLKNTSLAMTIGVAELTFATRQIETYTAKAFEAFTAGTLIYLVLCLGIAYAMNRVERKYAIPGLIARAGRAEH
ncbi:MAG: amino acid ABC transporter permease [Thermodesulfobacteriota bacterium]